MTAPGTPTGDAVTYRILIISAHADDVAVLEQALARAHDGPFQVESSPSLEDGMRRIGLSGIDAILLDLQLPDSHGVAGFEHIRKVAGHVPIMTLCALVYEQDAKESVRCGAQGWLSKGYFDNYLVPQSLRNIIERTKVEQGLYIMRARAEITLNSIGDAVVSTDTHGRVDYLNIAAEHIGWSRAQACGRPIAEVLHIVDSATGERILNPIEYALGGGQVSHLMAEAILVNRDGKRVPIEDSAAPIHDWDGQLVGAVMALRDVSDNVALTSKMRHLAQHDYLTNLPNRVC
jgi:PAS domain S-box-containing protein